MFGCSYTRGNNTYLLGFTVLMETLQSSSQIDRSKRCGGGKKKQGCDTFLPCHTFLSPPLRAEAQSGTRCVGAVLGTLKLQAPEPATQTAQTAHFDVFFETAHTYFNNLTEFLCVEQGERRRWNRDAQNAQRPTGCDYNTQ